MGAQETPPTTPPAATPTDSSAGPGSSALTAEQQTAVDAANLAIQKANQAQSNARDLRLQADALKSQANNITSATANLDQAVKALNDFFPTLRDAQQSSLLKRLSDAASGLDKNKADLQTAKTNLATGASSPNEVTAASSGCDKILGELAAEQKAASDSADGVKKALQVFYGYFGTQFDAVGNANKALTGLDEGADATRVRAAAGQMTAFPATLSNNVRLGVLWGQYSLLLADLAPSTDDLAAPVNTKRDTANTGIDSVVKKWKKWLTTMKAPVDSSAKDVNSVAADLQANYTTAFAGADSALNDAKAVSDASWRVVDAWYHISPKVPDPGPDGFDRDGTNTAATALLDARKALGEGIVRASDALSGDRSTWIADQVRLYYFTDVERLMEILNPNYGREGGADDAQAAASAARRALTDAELTLSGAQADVNKYQTRVLTLQEELRQAQAASKAKSILFGKTGGLVNRLTSKQSDAQSNFEELSQGSKENPGDPIAKAKADAAKKRVDDLSAQLTQARETNTNAQKDNDAAQQRLQAVQDEKDGLPAQIAEAKEALSQAQAAVAQKRKASFLAAQEESEAFAFARDHASHLKTRPIGSSTDPARRVEIYGFDDSKFVFLRGKEDDVRQVKKIIAGFDQPAPQARVTLWSLELNSAGGNLRNNDATRRFNRALGAIENDLATLRALNAASLSLLRDSINRRANGCVSGAVPINPDALRVARMTCFYADEVVLRLAGDPRNIRSFVNVSRITIPDPAATTTLGEALMVLSLAKRNQREQILDDFQDQVYPNLASLHLAAEPVSPDDSETYEPLNRLQPPSCDHFTLTRRALGLAPRALPGCAAAATPVAVPPLPPVSAYSELTPQQSELIYALQSKGLENIEKKIQALTDELQTAVAQKAKQTDAFAIEQYSAEIKTIGSRLGPLLFFVYARYGIGDQELIGSVDAIASENAAASSAVVASARGTLASLKRLDPLRTATPRVAAADEMLKEMMIAVEDDLDRLFVHPMLGELREKLAKTKNLHVGVLQRTSVLATNRLVARVDPRASAQLALGEEQDILQSIMQLGEIYLAAQTAGVFGTLNVLNAQKREPPPEIYSLNTGSEFKVTPIFDPSGQAMRFKFDYVAGTRIQEPDGTTNPQLPRIERHTVNTEVQITNMELREISRFESNARLGIPTRYWGGIPIIKDIPYVRPYVPLFGWFVRKAGTDAASQESILFGQTTIYPTIADIADLLAASEPDPRGN